MRRFKTKFLAAGILLSLMGGCLQTAGSPSGDVSNFSAPPAQAMTTNAAPAVAAEGGINPKPDTASLGNEGKKIWRAYYGKNTSLIQGMVSLDVNGEPVPLDLRVQKMSEDSQEWVDAPVGQKVRLFLDDPSADPSPDPETGDPLPQQYCDETVTSLHGNPPENISANVLTLKLGALSIYIYDPTNDFFDCANGWAHADPAMTSELLAMGSAFVGNITLKFPISPSNPFINNPLTPTDPAASTPPSGDPHPSERMLSPWNKVPPIHLP